jgi:hypothetical protein
MSYNPTSERLPLNYRDTTGQRPASHTGKGQSRPTTRKAAKTNNPLLLPPGTDRTSPRARRWRDIATFYAAQLGDRIKQEPVRALLISLVSMTLMLERLNDKVARDEQAVRSTGREGNVATFVA